MSTNQYTGEVVRIANLAGPDATIRDTEFADCQINGPAILAPVGPLDLNNCTFDGDIDALFWELAPGQALIGAVLLDGCRFIGCRFSLVGLVGDAEAIAKLRAGFAS